MSTITKLATKMLAMLSVVGLMASPVQALDAADMAFALGGQAPASARSMSAVEMDEIEGALAPIVVRAVVLGGIASVTNAANTRNNGGSTRQVIRAAAIGFVGGATAGVASKLLK